MCLWEPRLRSPPGKGMGANWNFALSTLPPAPGCWAQSLDRKRILSSETASGSSPFGFWKTSVLPLVKTITGAMLCMTSCSQRSGGSSGGEGQWQELEGRVASGTILLLVLGKDTLLQALLAQGSTLWISFGTGSAEKTWNSIPRERKKWDQKASGGNYAGCAKPAAALNPRAASTSRVPTLRPAGPCLPRAWPRPPSKPALTSGLPGASSAQAEET